MEVSHPLATSVLVNSKAKCFLSSSCMTKLQQRYVLLTSTTAHQITLAHILGRKIDTRIADMGTIRNVVLFKEPGIRVRCTKKRSNNPSSIRRDDHTAAAPVMPYILI